MTPRTTIKPINFMCMAPQAQAVSLVGDFNGWNPAANRMVQGPDKAWTATANLKAGHHRYAFLVDDVLTLDPRAQGITRNDQNQRVSLMPVS